MVVDRMRMVIVVKDLMMFIEVMEVLNWILNMF